MSKYLYHWLGIFGCLVNFCLYSCNTERQSLIIKGSDTEVNLTVLLAEAYHKSVPSVRISVSGGGTGVGIAAISKGLADIANASREMTESEHKRLQYIGIEVDKYIFAYDAIAIIVNEKLPIDELSVDDLRLIFSGEVTRWNAFADIDKRIKIYGRQSNSGTYDFFRDNLNIIFTKTARELNGNAQIIESVRNDLTGIGYVGLGYVIKNGKPSVPGVKILKIAEEGYRAVSPLELTSYEDLTYRFKRPLYQYVRRDAHNRAKGFLDFIQSGEGKNIILANGYFPHRS